MSESHAGAAQSIAGQRPHCDYCNLQMWLWSIKPAKPGFELLTFECARCAASQTVLTPVPARAPSVIPD